VIKAAKVGRFGLTLTNPTQNKPRNYHDIYNMPAASLRPASQAGLLLIYLLFCGLMLRIISQYIPAGTDTAFLGIKQQYIDIPGYLAAFYIHVFTALLALPAGLTQFFKTILRRRPRIHRVNGRVYVLSILLLGGPSGFFIGIWANGGLSSQIAFCLLAILWVFFTARAWRHAVAGRIRQHKADMYRSFALTLSAITLRAWKYVIIAGFHPRPMDAYRIVAWLGWTLNLAIAEYLILKKQRI
jgi:uncharacterized membrane protein